MECKSKTVRGAKVVAVASAVCALALAGCASGKVKVEDVKVEDVSAKAEVIDHKGVSFGLEIPEWTAAVAAGNKDAVKKALGIDKNAVVFLVYQQGDNLDFLQTWADQFGARDQVASAMETTISNVAKTQISGESTDGTSTTEQSLEKYSGQVTNITLNGLQKENDYWTKTRRLKDGITKAQGPDDYEYKINYVAVFWMDGKLFARQLNEALSDVDENDDQSAALRSLITEQCVRFLTGNDEYTLEPVSATPAPTPAPKEAAVVLGEAGLSESQWQSLIAALSDGCTIVLPQELSGEDVALFAAALAASSLTGVSLDMSLLAAQAVADVLPAVVADLERRDTVALRGRLRVASAALIVKLTAAAPCCGCCGQWARRGCEVACYAGIGDEAT